MPANTPVGTVITYTVQASFTTLLLFTTNSNTVTATVTVGPSIGLLVQGWVGGWLLVSGARDIADACMPSLFTVTTYLCVMNGESCRM